MSGKRGDDFSYSSGPLAVDRKHIVDFVATCRCGWKYGPGIQTDVVQQVKYHRQSERHQARLNAFKDAITMRVPIIGTAPLIVFRWDPNKYLGCRLPRTSN